MVVADPRQEAAVDLGKLARKVKSVVDTKGDKIASGIDKATDVVDKKTKGKYHDKLQKVDGMAEKLDKTKQRPAAESADGPGGSGPAERPDQPPVS
jgi:hypothetical protein